LTAPLRGLRDSPLRGNDNPEREKQHMSEIPPNQADETAGGPEPEGPVDTKLPEDLPAAYLKLLTEKQELFDRLLRKQAELENFRKRLQREKEEFVQHATADLLRALLPVLDSFERALRHRDETVPEPYVQGVKLIYQELLEVMSRAGVTPLETTGKSFDPHLHQAVETVEAPGHRDQEIVEELQRGYKLRHRLLRPAVVKVAVSRKAAKGKEEGPDGSKANSSGVRH
jgi:molecular chaperone GrpE